jgi:solute carrier family 39 (zinc transporter), member 11
MVEPIFGVLGAVAVSIATKILPIGLAFAAGAMIFIVADDIIPEAHSRYFSIKLSLSFSLISLKI